MITESTINQILGQFESGETDLEEAVRELAGRQPALLSYLMSDQEGALTEDEQDYLLYLAIVIWRSVEHTGPESPQVSTKQIAEAEELNWDEMERSKGKTFREKLNPFFETTHQEDLLAFIEDALMEEEEDTDPDVEIVVTNEGREPMFVALKTLVDVLTD